MRVVIPILDQEEVSIQESEDTGYLRIEYPPKDVHGPYNCIYVSRQCSVYVKEGGIEIES